MILAIRNGFAAMRGKKIAKSVFDQLPILLAHAEARLDFALWREAYRRLGWNHRLVPFNVFEPPQTWDETATRFESYRRANMNLEACVRLYAEDLRQRYGIARREAAAHGSTDARLSRAAHHGLAAAATLISSTATIALTLSSVSSARPSKDERGYVYARGPPLATRLRATQSSPPRKHSLPGPRPHAPTSAWASQASACRY